MLHEAAWNGFSRCVKLLCNVYPKDLEENSKKEQISGRKSHFINRVNFCGFSALHLAAQNGHNQTLRELLYAGGSTSIHNDYGDTPLHTACRYGHAGVVRILISAKSNVNAFNLNHDTPLHITCAMGRRKLTKLLLEADALEFQNMNHETPSDIATRKDLREITEIMTTYRKKLERRKLKQAIKKSDSPDSHQILSSSSKLKNQQHWSPYGCHYYPDTRNFPSPNIASLPKEPLVRGEQYYLDLAGNICKGPIGQVKQCCCAIPDQKRKCANLQLYGKGSINKLAEKFVKTAIHSPGYNKMTRKQTDDLTLSLSGFVKDEHKRFQLEQWLYKVEPEIGSNCNLHERDENLTVDVFRKSTVKGICTPGASRHIHLCDNNGNDNHLPQEKDDENYTDISNEESEKCSLSSVNGKRLYDENFMHNFQQQQQLQNTGIDDSVESPSLSSNQNIEKEMERITKSLLLGGLMISTNPDVIRDHIHHSAKRSTNKTKSAITKSTILASGDLYVNTFFNNSKSIIKKISNPSTISSLNLEEPQSVPRFINVPSQTVRSRNPLPVNIEELENLQKNLVCTSQTVSPPLDNAVVLDNKLKRRRIFNLRHHQQQLLENDENSIKLSNISSFNEDRRTKILSSSTLV